MHRITASRDEHQPVPRPRSAGSLRRDRRPGVGPVRIDAGSPDAVTALQRSAGNTAVAALIARQAEAADEAAEHEATRVEAGGAAAGPRVVAPHGHGGRGLGRDRSRFEAHLGADLGGVRLHTGAGAEQLTAALHADAATLDGDVFFARDMFAPGTAAGDRLLAHELTHAARHPGRLHLRRVDRRLDFLRFKRKGVKLAKHWAAGLAKLAPPYPPYRGRSKRDEQLPKWIENADDPYGHWWTEVGELTADEKSWYPYGSYGWWPPDEIPIPARMKLFGQSVPGELNQGLALDKHHGESADEEFHPVLDVEEAESYWGVRGRVETDVTLFD